MNWDIIQGQWKQMTGKIREKWGKLTDSELEQVSGTKDRFVGLIQERYGYAKERAEQEVDDFFNSQKQ
jgi:uncharacterized protein YjbJ (UPF0337 family)